MRISDLIINMFALTPVKASFDPLKLYYYLIIISFHVVGLSSTITSTFTYHKSAKKFKLVTDSFKFGKVACYIISTLIDGVEFSL